MPSLLRFARSPVPRFAAIAALGLAPATARAATTPSFSGITAASGITPAVAHGSADPGASVVLYASAGCDAGTEIGSGSADGSGQFAIALAAAGASVLHARAFAGSTSSACTWAGLPYYPEHAAECPSVPADLPITRPPRLAVMNTLNRFFQWAHTCHASSCPPGTDYGDYLAPLAEDQPDIEGPGNFAGDLPFSPPFGVPKGVDIDKSPDYFGTPYAMYGNSTQMPANQTIDAGVLSPNDLWTRYQDMQRYLGTYKGVTKHFAYIDFASQFFGDQVTRSGVFDFYDHHWDDFVAAGFDLGQKPDNPSNWLKRWFDAGPGNGHPQYPGLSFDYGPDKDSYAPYHRYSVNPASSGWAAWWGQSVRWAASAGYPLLFVDNAALQNCYNTECQAGYLAYLAAHHSQEEIDRHYTYADELWSDGSFEGPWVKDALGHWKTLYATAIAGQMFPDTSSLRGLYSARIEQGAVQGYGIPGAGNYRFTGHYRMNRGDTGHLTLLVTGGATNTYHEIDLDKSESWAEVSYDLPVGQGEILYATWSTPGTMWVDEQWLTRSVDVNGVVTPTPPKLVTELWGRDGTRLDAQPRLDATLAYWDSVVDARLPYLRDMGAAERSGFQLFANGARQRPGADYYMIEVEAMASEISRQDVGAYPGLYHPDPDGTLRGQPVTQDVLETNDFDYRYTSARRLTDAFAYGFHYARDSGAPYTHNLDSAELLFAEAAAFGGGVVADTGVQQTYWFYTASETDHLRSVSRNFFQFVNNHAELFSCLAPQATIGFLVKNQRDADAERAVQDLARGVAGRGALWDVITGERMTPQNLARYKVIVVQGIDSLAEADADKLLGFAAAGGTVIVGGSVGRTDELGRMREAYAPSPSLWPAAFWDGTGGNVSVGSGHVNASPTALDDTQLWTQITAALGGAASALPSTPAAVSSRMRVAAWQGWDRQIVHLVDYDVPLGKNNGGQAATRTGITVRLPLVPGVAPTLAHIYDPSTGGVTTAPVTPAPGGFEFTVPSMRIYAVADVH